MTQTQSPNPRKVCEHIIREGRLQNIENSIWPSEVAIADRLLARGPEMAAVYEELHGKLCADPIALQVFLELVLNVAAFWNPERNAKARAERDELGQVNRQIAMQARELTALFRRRSELHNTTGFTSDTHYDICGVIDAAAKSKGLFKAYVQGPLNALRVRFDMKYWPSLGDVMHELAVDAEASSPEATDSLTEAATASMRSSMADFYKALFVAIDENSVRKFGHLPRGLRVSDETIATLANCALNLEPAAMMDGPYVKRLRQRIRDEVPSLHRSGARSSNGV